MICGASTPSTFRGSRPKSKPSSSVSYGRGEKGGYGGWVVVGVISLAVYLVWADFKVSISSSFLSAILLVFIVIGVYRQLARVNIKESYESFETGNAYRPMGEMGNIPIAPSFAERCANIDHSGTTDIHQSGKTHSSSPALSKIDVSLFDDIDKDPFNPTYVTANNVNTFLYPKPPPPTPEEPLTGCNAKFHDLNDKNDPYFSLNQNLVGGVNPKTKHAPVVPPRLFEETWSKNDRFFVNSGINDQKQQEYYQNGYISYDNRCCPTTASSPGLIRQTVQENYEEPLPDYSTSQGSRVGHSHRHPSQSSRPPEIFIEDDNFAPMNLSFGYFPENAQVNRAVNFPQSSNLCATPDYNRQIRTTPLQPGLVAYSEVDVNDASMSNLGISYTQPFLPTKLVDLAGTDKSFIESDPFWKDRPSNQRHTQNFESAYGIDPIQPNHHYSEHYQPHKNSPFSVNGPAMMDRRSIYDPRLTGYGTSYRGYTDPMSGQPRYFYDDVDAHTQYNYITKSKIDHLPQTIQSGPYQPSMMNNMEVREYAQQQFLNQTLQQRTELQDRLMQKVLHRNIQRHQAPIMTRNTGSMNMTRARG